MQQFKICMKALNSLTDRDFFFMMIPNTGRHSGSLEVGLSFGGGLYPKLYLS